MQTEETLENRVIRMIVYLSMFIVIGIVVLRMFGVI